MIKLKTPEEIEILRQGGKKLANVLNELGKMIAPGISTAAIEKAANDLIAKAGGRPSFLGYPIGPEGEGYPTALCISIDKEVVHAPSLPPRILKEGSVVTIDIGMEYPISSEEGLYTDMAATFPVGKIMSRSQELIKVTKEALYEGIKKAVPGNRLSDIGIAIQNYAEDAGFSVVKDLVGHGVGYAVHEDPQVPNFEADDSEFEDVLLEPGLVIAIEPMINEGGADVKIAKNGFTFYTRDGRPSAQFEHTIAITETGNIILTDL